MVIGFPSDTHMDDCSPAGPYDSGNDTEELPFGTTEDEASDSETEEEENIHHPFGASNSFNFSMGLDIQPTGSFPRRHEETRNRDPSRRKTRYLSQSSHSVVPSQRQRSSCVTNFNGINPPTPVTRSQTISVDFSFAAPVNKEPVSPYKPPTTFKSKSLRSQSMMNVITDSPTNPFTLIPPIPLETLPSKENQVNIPCTGSAFPVKPKTERSGEPSSFFAARRTTSDVVLPSPPMFDKRTLQRRSTDTTQLLYPPKLLSKRRDACEFISIETVLDLLLGKHSKDFDSVLIIDCRYTYEYEGGHIPNALSILPAEREQCLRQRFMEKPFNGNRVAIVFHCEFSSKRGPATCRRLREMDREAHGFLKHDELFYPYLYVMEGGYQNFYRAYPSICQGIYVEMKDKRFKGQLKDNKRLEKRACEKVKRSSSVVVSRKRLTRSHQSLSFSTDSGVP